METREEQEPMDFGEALSYLKSQRVSGGIRVTRTGWVDTAAKPKVCLQVPDENSKMTEPYLYMEKFTNNGVARFPIDLSCESLLAEDWIIAD